MAQPFEDFLVELAEKGDCSVLDRLPNYLTGHYVDTGNAVAERERLIVAFGDKAPRTTLSERMREVIIESGK
jgi:hypothetical protein